MDKDTTAESSESLTSSTEVRWTYLGSAVAAVILIGFAVVVGAAMFGYADLTAVNAGWFSLVWLVVVTTLGWLYGADIAKGYNQYKKQK